MMSKPGLTKLAEIYSSLERAYRAREALEAHYQSILNDALDEESEPLLASLARSHAQLDESLMNGLTRFFRALALEKPSEASEAWRAGCERIKASLTRVWPPLNPKVPPPVSERREPHLGPAEGSSVASSGVLAFRRTLLVEDVMVPVRVETTKTARARTKFVLTPEALIFRINPQELPRFTPEKVELRLEEAMPWLKRHLSWFRRHHDTHEAAKSTYRIEPYGEVLLFGERATLVVTTGPSRYEYLPEREPHYVIYLRGSPEGSREALSEALKAFYKSVLRARVEKTLARLLAQHSIKAPSKVRMSSSKTRWASCSSRGVLSFSFYLAMMAPESIDYVVAHELSHRVHMNHSAAFWAQVEAFCPAYREQEAYLKGFVIKDLPLGKA